MALLKELIHVLDNKEEPLAKRLKIADNAFKSNELPVQNREVILLKWISKLLESNDVAIWKQCNEWMSSDQMKDLSRSDINLEDIQIITETIVKRFKSCEEPSNEICNMFVNFSIMLIENRVLQQYFKYNLNIYFEYISNIINNINDEQLLLKFIKTDQLFNKNFIADEKFHKIFFEKTLILLSNTALKFQNNCLIFEEVSKIYQRCLFQKNYKSFEMYFDYFFEEGKTEEKPIVPKLLLKHLRKIYALSNEESKCCYKLLLHAFCTTYNDFAMIHKFTILLISNLGFNLENLRLSNTIIVKNPNLSKSLEILTGIFEVLSKNKNTFNHKVNGVTFTDLLQNLLKSIMKITRKPNINTVKLLNLAIRINPLVIEPILPIITVYIMLSNHNNYKSEYEELLTSIFEVFSKLHRIQNLISKMIPSLKDAVNGNILEIEEAYPFLGTEDNEVYEIIQYSIDDVLPKSVMEYFMQCITSLASWQVMNLYKTLLFHLDNALENDTQYLTETTDKSIYIEIICTLMCEFLSSVRIEEHTVPVLVVQKFVKSMDDQRLILGKFGTALVAIEHNHSLMRAYLNVCYTWAELYMNLSYYSLNQEVQVNKQQHSDNSACNITYLHSYLTSDQWCLISERITNFGERPCKQIMQKLCIQKLRAMLIFETSINDDILSSITNNISTSIEDYCDLLVNDKFALTIILPKMGSNILSVSDCLVDHLITYQNFDCLKTTKDSNLLSRAILYSTLANINKLFKIKRKHDEKLTKSFVSTKIFSKIKENELDCSNQKLSEISSILNSELTKEDDGIEFIINEDKCLLYLNIVKNLPVTFLSENVQSMMYMYFSSILYDLKKSNQNVKNDIENILLGIVQNGSISLPDLYKPNVLMTFIKNIKTCNETFECVLENALKNEKSIQKLKKAITYLVKDLSDSKNLKCAVSTLEFILKHKKSKISAENKIVLEEYKQKICEGIIKLIDENTDNTNIEAYALVLKIYMASNDIENIDLLKKHLEIYIAVAMKNSGKKYSTGCLVLFLTILQNKAKFEDVIKDDYVLNIYNISVKMDVTEKHTGLFSKLIVSIFEHIPNEEFSSITTDLLKNTLSTMKESNFPAFSSRLRTWNSILGCSFNPTKTKIWLEAVQSLLLNITENYKIINNEDVAIKDLIQFEINLIQTTQLLLTPSIIDTFFYTISNLITKETDFNDTFTSCISIMEGLLRYRKAAVCDRLPSLLQQYRKLLSVLCKNSNSNIQMDVEQIQKVQDCAHQFEKLTKNLTSYNKHMASVSIYVISDILEQYETVTLYPGVKLHLNNCLYSLMSLCDQHAVSCLMRVLSTASTEIFKLLYETYKKYYRFTGKV